MDCEINLTPWYDNPYDGRTPSGKAPHEWDDHTTEIRGLEATGGKNEQKNRSSNSKTSHETA